MIGHQKQWKFLKKVTEAGKISQAYLFTGQEKLGKKKVALEWASLLLGQDIQKHKRQRSVEEETEFLRSKYNPDLFLIEPQGKEIQISQIRELIQKLSLKPYSREMESVSFSRPAPFKVAIIDRAHLMNQEAQSAFLKTLEEPRGKTLLILITEFPEALFPTILSRVQVIKFYPVKEQEIKEYLRKQKIKAQEIKEIIGSCFGKPGLAIDFILNPEKLKNERKIIKELIALFKANLSFRFQYAKKLAGEENLREILNTWLRYFREKLILFPETPDEIHKLKNIIKQIQNVNFLLSTTNVNPKLALEILMLEL